MDCSGVSQKSRSRRAAPVRDPMSELTPAQKKRERRLRSAKAVAVAEHEQQQALACPAQTRASARLQTAGLQKAQEAAAGADSDSDVLSDQADNESIGGVELDLTFAQQLTADLHWLRLSFEAI